MARPSEYDPELVTLILERHANGESIRSICADPSMPKATTLGKWRAKYPEFDTQYMHARQLAGEAEADLAKQYSETTHVKLPNGMYVPMDVQRSRLMADTAKWRAAKLFPKEYGDKQFVEHSGSLTLIDATEEDLVAELVELVASGRLALPNGAQLVTDDATGYDPDDFDHGSLA